MSTHNITFFNIYIKNIPKLSQICHYGICSKGLKSEFETAVVNEPSVFEPSKFYCICILPHENLLSIKEVMNKFLTRSVQNQIQHTKGKSHDSPPW